MHQPRPHGTFGTDSEEDAAALEMLARRLTNLKDTSGLSSVRLTRTLPSGAMAVATDAGGIFKIIVQPRPGGAPTVQTDGLARAQVPMLFCGVIANGAVRGSEGVRIKLTQTTRRRLVAYDPESKLPPDEVSLQRFVIDHHERVPELLPKRLPEDVRWTQYVNQRPTWYSGAMAEVVQIVGGYGRQDLKALPDDKIERARMLLPAEVVRKIEEELGGNRRLPGYLGVPPKSGQFQYDYKYGDTDGVGFDSKGRPWLIKVGPRGVHAMPLPVVPATTTRAFRGYMEKVGDEEVLWILDRFGGMPSGESFPVQEEDFESWRRAGVIIKVCGAGHIYDHWGYTSAMGWAFNSRGTEGFNTCFDYDDAGIGYGLAFKLSLRLGAAEYDGRLPSTFHPEDPQQAAAMDAYLSAVYRLLDTDGARELAIKYKLRRSIPQVLERVGRSGGNAAAEVDYWDNLEAAPLAAHSGSVNEVARGPLWHPAPKNLQPQIKFPEPYLDGCVSHDFGWLKGYPKPQGVRCDTVMFGYYVGDALKVAKYFFDGREFEQEVRDNFEQCMAVGSWERTTTTGLTGLLGHFYTSDFDEREAAAPTTTTQTIVGTDLGYDTEPWFAFDSHYQTTGTIWRHRYFQHRTKRDTTEGFSKNVAVCVPYAARNALVHAHKESTTGAVEEDSLGIGSVRDPNSYRMHTYHRIWAWSGGSFDGNMATAASVYPPSTDGNPVYVRGHNYHPSPCSDFADQGNWLGGLPQDLTWLVHPVSSVWNHKGGGGAPTVKEYSRRTTLPPRSSGLLQISSLARPEVVNKAPAPGYFKMSPDEKGYVFYADAIHNTAGDAIYANVSEPDPEAPKQRKRWGFTRLADHKSSHHFIGVINE